MTIELIPIEMPMSLIFVLFSACFWLLLPLRYHSIIYTHILICRPIRDGIAEVRSSSSHRVQIAIQLGLDNGLRERRKPGDRKAPEDRLEALPARLAHPSGLLLFQLFDALRTKWSRQILSTQNQR